MNFTLEKLVLITNLQYKSIKIKVISMTNMNNKFEADTGKILDIVINSLYSEREIFLRELISNASDALDKRKYLGLTDKKIANSSETPEVIIEVDNKEKTLTISDNGIGMNEEDLKSSLGTIARSGTKAFLEQISKSNKDKKLKKYYL